MGQNESTGPTRAEMVDFLKSHFRYDTMNGWNRSTSYARNVKLGRLAKEIGDHDDACWKYLSDQRVSDDTAFAIEQFTEAHDGRWTIGTNGRSSGYLVLYRSKYEQSEHKTICRSCWQKNYRADTAKCGRCGAENMHPYSARILSTYPGKPTDMGEDFDPEEWDDDAVRSRYELVMAFDAACDDIVHSFVQACVQCAEEDKEEAVEQAAIAAGPVGLCGDSI